MDELENSDDSELSSCRHCRELIVPGTEIPWNGWDWHVDCVPAHVLIGIDRQAWNDAKDGK